MDSEFLSKVINLHKLNDWQNILKLNEYSNNQYARKILWVWPSLPNLNFIKTAIEKNCCTGIISLGCGSGLLEWIIEQSTGR